MITAEDRKQMDRQVARQQRFQVRKFFRAQAGDEYKKIAARLATMNTEQLCELFQRVKSKEVVK